jgi:hypothetical protein
VRIGDRQWREWAAHTRDTGVQQRAQCEYAGQIHTYSVMRSKGLDNWEFYAC